MAKEQHVILLLFIWQLFGCSVAYHMVANYSGPTFFEKWDFFTGDDPSHGYVNYVDETTAKTKGFISLKGTMAYIGSDHSNIAKGRGRDSVRIITKEMWQTGLFLINLAHMPSGCGTWPAWWLLGSGKGWPEAGEIDIIEGINLNTQDQTTLHTTDGCDMANEPWSDFTGKWSCGSTPNSRSTNCYINAPNQYSNQGCGIIANGTGTYGKEFNKIGGGVFATEWTNDVIQMWFFPRGSIPIDIVNNKPNPTTWNKPYARFPLGPNCPSTHFHLMKGIINTDFCGWAGDQFESQCPGKGSCQSFIQNNPKEFVESYWLIHYLQIYQK